MTKADGETTMRWRDDEGRTGGEMATNGAEGRQSFAFPTEGEGR